MMHLFFPRLSGWQYALLVALFVFCLAGNDPFAVRLDGMVLAEPFTIIAAGAAMGALSGGASLLGQHMARKAHANSALGKAEAAIAKDQAKIARTPLSKLGLSESQKRKAVTMALEQARSQKRQLEAQQARGMDYRGPARSGIEALREGQMRDMMLQAGAQARTNIEAQSAQMALARKQGAVGTVMPMAQAQQAQMLQTGAAVGEAAAGGIAGGVTAGMSYGQGVKSTDTTGTSAVTVTNT
jgi:hypothetical protein